MQRPNPFRVNPGLPHPKHPPTVACATDPPAASRMETMTQASHLTATSRSLGTLYTACAYLLWGVLPRYIVLTKPASALEVVALRVVFTLAVCAVLLTLTRTWVQVRLVLRARRTLGVLAIAGLLVYANWMLYTFAALSGHVVEASLGYFINPIVTVLLGVVFLREKVEPLQWVALALAGVAVVVLTVSYGRVPVIALGLAASFGLYALAKNRAGVTVGAVAGLASETLLLLPVALVQLWVVSATIGLSIGRDAVAGQWHTLTLVGLGVVTATPLLFFAAGARRVPLVTVGLLQFLGPVLQFCVGVFVFGEHMAALSWVGFALVWCALVLIVVGLLRGVGARRV